MAYFPVPVPAKERWGAARKYAAIILVTHPSTYDVVMEFGAMRWLGLSANVDAARWEKPKKATVPRSSRAVELVRGEGTLDHKPAELAASRQVLPGERTVFLLGALRADAPREAREAFYASFASYEPVK